MPPPQPDVMLSRANCSIQLTANPPGQGTSANNPVHAGGVYLYPSLAKTLVQDYLRRAESGDEKSAYDGLTEREREILCLVATDHTNSEIADVLHLSKQTVHNIRARLMEKLGFHDRLQLVKYAIRRRIVGLEEV